MEAAANAGTSTMPEAVELFDWLRELAAATGRGKVTRGQAGVAMFVALECKGTTGDGAFVDYERLRHELGISERQVWRHFTALVTAGWFCRTQAPARGYRGEKGRRALYRLTRPRLDMTGVLRLPDAAAAVSDDARQDTGTSDTSSPERLTLPSETSATTEPDAGTVPPADVPPADVPPTGPVSASTPDRASGGAEQRTEIWIQALRQAQQANRSAVNG